MEVHQYADNINPDVIRALRHYVVRDDYLWERTSSAGIEPSEEKGSYLARLLTAEGNLVDILVWIPAPVRRWEHLII